MNKNKFTEILDDLEAQNAAYTLMSLSYSRRAAIDGLVLLNTEPIKPKEVSKEPTLNDTDEKETEVDQDQELIKKRGPGRPPKYHPLTEREKYVIPDYVNYPPHSVKIIPCYCYPCDHAYTRPGTTQVEQTDRRLPVHSKFFNRIRTCKFHLRLWQISDKVNSH
jgi:hypothetical protein